MGFKKNSKGSEERFVFTPQARAAFAKEMSKCGFDFDRFLLSKEAIGRRKGSVTALEYETLEAQTAYVTKHVRTSPYFTFEAGTLNWAWKHPFLFWLELRVQSSAEESKMLWDCDRLEETRTGQSKEERARSTMKSLAKTMEGLVSLKSYA